MTTEKEIKFNYLTEEERKMPLDMILLQISMGLQSCKTKGDVMELLKDLVNIGIQQGRERRDDEVEKVIDEMMVIIGKKYSEQSLSYMYLKDLKRKLGLKGK